MALEDFRDALRAAYLADARGHRELAPLVARAEGRAKPYDPSMLSSWAGGAKATIPDPDQVFALEQVLNLPAGSLSRHLGYLPLEASPQVTVIQAIDQDPTLTEDFKAVLREAYAASVRASSSSGSAA